MTIRPFILNNVNFFANKFVVYVSDVCCRKSIPTYPKANEYNVLEAEITESKYEMKWDVICSTCDLKKK